MQAQLEIACSGLAIPPPVYLPHGRKEINGIQYCRYYGCLSYGGIGWPAVCVGRYGKDEYDACKDVVAMLLHRLLSNTGRRIRDFNYYNVIVLEGKLNRALDENFKLQTEISLLTTEMSLLRGRGGRWLNVPCSWLWSLTTWILGWWSCTG